MPTPIGNKLQSLVLIQFFMQVPQEMMVKMSSSSQSQYAIISISVSIGRPATFVVRSSEESELERFTTSRLLILQTLIPALFNRDTTVKLDKVEGSNVIQRVQAFSIGTDSSRRSGLFMVTRIATQRKPNGEDEHLEVFVTKDGEDGEKAYNVFDPMLQTLLIAAFCQPSSNSRPDSPVHLDFYDGEIATVTLGQDTGF
ncbi:MAG: hypothetical protein U0996_08520 [Planctomycetaceae bacterium]